MTFSLSQIPSLAGKVVVVTGANIGVGYETALAVAAKGAHTFVLGRSRERVDAAVAKIRAQTGNSQVEGELIDVSSLRSVRAFADRFRSRNLPLHVLVNNAGVFYPAFGITEDGIEFTWETNHVGPWYLTSLLLDIVKASAPARIVFVSSQMHAPKELPLTLEAVNAKFGSEYKSERYSQTKLGNYLTALEIHRRLRAEGVHNVYVNSVHPGFVKTDILNKAEPDAARDRIQALANEQAIGVEEGALTQIYAAVSPEIEEKSYSGRFFFPIAKLFEPTTPFATEEHAAQLWKFTEDLVNSKIAA